MASIQDLVQQKVKQSQSGQNQFADPTAGTIFDIIKMIESNKDKANIQDRQLLIDVNQLSVGASSPTEFENISNVLNNLSPSPELQPIQQSLLTGIENKTAIYNSALPHFQEVAASFGKGDPRLDKYTFTKGKILNLKASDTPEGKKGLDFLRTEIERVGLMKEHLNNAKGFNYAKHSNIPMKSVIDKVDKYYETLNEAFLAAPGGISPREANAIFFGDYGDVQKQRISFITGQMEDERTRVNSLKRKLVSTQNSYRAEVARAQTGGGGINTAAFFPDFTEDEQSKGAPTGDSATYKDIVDFYVKEIDDIENSEHGTLKALKTEYNFWSIEGPLEDYKEKELEIEGEETTQERLEREAERDRQLKLAQLGIQAKQAEAYGQYMTKPDAFTVKTQIVRELAGSGPPGGKAGTSDNEYVVWEQVTEEGVPKLDAQGSPVLESTLTELGARFAGELSQQGTIQSAEMRLEAQLWDQARKIVENDKSIMDVIEEPKAILAEAKKTYGPTPTQEELDEVEKSRKSRAIWDGVQTLRTSTRLQQGGGRVLSTPTPVGLPSVQQMLE